ncbi:hypothetical protein NJL88_02845 [Streptomyces sp. DK15]|uniref:hypothetical protein n=1 Tax=Streptomyces sp. DK15 TaxID=2957499 RepID=UPI0029AA184B|nr:hypothetical protein [Streptomyces sp. DK15]MDX2389041.1 hypothetical protein [Streptomyces sp. DK15]
MRIRDENAGEGRGGEPGLTTEDLARSGGAERRAPLYPGEATTGPGDDGTRDDGTREGGTRDDGTRDVGTRAEEYDPSRTDRTDRTDRTADPITADADVDATADVDGTTDVNGATDRNGSRATTSDVDAADDTDPLLPSGEAQGFRKSWSDIQSRFVDDPQEAVRSADALVAEVMQTLAGSFAAHKQGLEGRWDRGEQVATEDLRLALQHYRSFFNRLLKT